MGGGGDHHGLAPRVCISWGFQSVSPGKGHVRSKATRSSAATVEECPAESRPYPVPKCVLSAVGPGLYGIMMCSLLDLVLPTPEVEGAQMVETGLSHPHTDTRRHALLPLCSQTDVSFSCCLLFLHPPASAARERTRSPIAFTTLSRQEPTGYRFVLFFMYSFRVCIKCMWTHTHTHSILEGQRTT